MKTPKAVTGVAWVGVWRDGSLGFCAPEFVHRIPNGMSLEQRNMLEGKGWYPSDLYRVRITMRIIKNKKGKPIVRRNKGRDAT